MQGKPQMWAPLENVANNNDRVFAGSNLSPNAKNVNTHLGKNPR
jgi:hypothetical protein